MHSYYCTFVLPYRYDNLANLKSKMQSNCLGNG
jgi:hypothetical protein